VIDQLKKLFQHVACRWAVSPVDSRLHYIESLALVVTAIGCA
jgi:hypothetical protein